MLILLLGLLIDFILTKKNNNIDTDYIKIDSLYNNIDNINNKVDSLKLKLKEDEVAIKSLDDSSSIELFFELVQGK